MFFDSLQIFEKPIRIILSTDDIVASNFQDALKNNKSLKKGYKRKKIFNYVINGADHTFVDPVAKKKLFTITLKALNEIESQNFDKMVSLT